MGWLGRLFDSGKMERELDAELRHHLELLVRAKMRTGLTEVEALREAGLEFGGLEQVKQDCRESRGTMFVATILYDLHFAARQMRKHPGFAAVTILTLGLGIGAATATFSVFETTLLRPLPYADPSRLVILWSMTPTFGFSGPGALTDPDYTEWEQQNQIFDGIAAFRQQASNLTGGGVPERLLGATTTASLFPLLGVAPELGRAFTRHEQIAGHNDVVLISRQLWARRFSSDPQILGRTIKLDGKNVSVVGVMPAWFQFPNKPDFWIPTVLTNDRSNATNEVIARLKTGVTLERAAKDITLLQHRINPEHAHDEIHLSFASLQEKLSANYRSALIVLLASVALVLLIACANVANLFLSRATSRRQEILMRRALGASRLRIVRQLLTESTLIAAIGGAVGVLLALAMQRLLIQLLPQNATAPGLLHGGVESEIDAWVLAFSALTSLATGVLFGLAPALNISRTDSHAPLRNSSSTQTSEAGTRRIRNGLVIAEFALTVVLLVGAALLLESFVRMMRVNPGIEPRNVAIVHIELPQPRYLSVAQMTVFHDDVLDRVAALPGVRSVGSVGQGMPFSDSGVEGDFTIEGEAQPPRDLASKVVVSRGYFQALSIPMIVGRAFNRDDTAHSQRVVIVSQSFARHFWPGQQVIGKRIGHFFGEKDWSLVVGVVGDVKQGGLSDDVPLTVYLPYAQGPIFFASQMTLVVRTESNPLSIIGAIRAVVRSVDPEIPIFDTASMDDLISKSVSQPRFDSALLAAFASLALILAVVGIYGVMSYSVIQRQQEIGIRMALGANRSSVTRMVVREGARLAALGIAIGISVALAMSHLISAFLVGVAPRDPATFFGASVLLLALALAACFVPARRASRVEPILALRHD
jgi:putative ABC transport system permease protein